MQIPYRKILRGQKMLCILELYHYGEFTSDISAKCELFNWYFGD